MRSPLRLGSAALCGFTLLLTSGCGKVDPTARLAELNSSNVQRLSNIYVSFQSAHALNGPRNEGDLRRFVERLRPAALERIGIDPNGIDSLFLSERDGQPFVIRYGVRGSVMGSNEPVIFEAEGSDGRRMVGFLNSTSREVDEAEYDQLWTQGARALASG